MKIKIFAILLLSSILIETGCSNQKNTDDSVWMANPASVYCEANSWTLELIYDAWKSYWICHFSDWSSCEEREYFRGECKTNQMSWNIEDFQWCMDAGYPIMESYPRQCKTPEWKSFTEDIESWSVENIVCTMEAKKCPDGSFVSRTWPNCEFTSCTGSENVELDWSIKKILEDHKNKKSQQQTWITEDDIDLIEKIIEKIK
jgi:putative hemolysin